MVTASKSNADFQQSLVMACLLGVSSMLACVMVALRQATWLEAVSFVTGAVCVWLTVKQNIWNFPIGLINVATFCVVFFHSRLFADAGLQVVYFVLGAIGWYLWHRGGEDRAELKVSRATAVEMGVLLAFIATATIGLWQVLQNFTERYLAKDGTLEATIGLWQVLQQFGGSASFWDALTTAISLAAQWLLNRKRLESWVGWIIVDIIYVPLYVYKELYLTAILYAIFLVMAVMGLRAWCASWLAQQVEVI